MKYYEVEDILDRGGLRLVLSRGMPGPWGLAARSLFDFKGVPYIAASQHPGGDNRVLAQISGQTSAPVALYNDERPAILWTEIVNLAEQLAPAPQLVPGDWRQRAQMFGLIHEIVGHNGFGWCRRLQMFAPMMERPDPGPLMTGLARKYGYSVAAAASAEQRCLEFLEGLAALLADQHARGSDYLVGDQVTAADIYWAHFSGLLRPLEQTVNPMPAGMRERYTAPAAILQQVDEQLLAHRDMMFQRHLTLPLDYLAD